jgi:phage terminase small subunit
VATVRDYQLDEHHLAVLGEACQAMDRIVQAREAIAEEGAVVADRFGQLKPSPWVIIERDNRLSLIRAVRDLGLDVEQSATRSGAY